MDNKSLAEEFGLRLRKSVAYALAKRGLYNPRIGEELSDDIFNGTTDADTKVNLIDQIGLESGDNPD